MLNLSGDSLPCAVKMLMSPARANHQRSMTSRCAINAVKLGDDDDFKDDPYDQYISGKRMNSSNVVLIISHVYYYMI